MENKIKEILNYVHSWGGEYNEWYCGITSDPRDRLFNGHRVLEKGVWVYDSFEDSNLTRNVERYFLDKLGFDGGLGGGDESAIFVYVYKKTLNTIE